MGFEFQIYHLWAGEVTLSPSFLNYQVKMISPTPYNIAKKMQ